MHCERARLDYERTDGRIEETEGLLTKTDTYRPAFSRFEIYLRKALQFLGRTRKTALVVTHIYLSDLGTGNLTGILHIETYDELPAILGNVQV